MTSRPIPSAGISPILSDLRAVVDRALKGARNIIVVVEAPNVKKWSAELADHARGRRVPIRGIALTLIRRNIVTSVLPVKSNVIFQFAKFMSASMCPCHSFWHGKRKELITSLALFGVV